ncbi:molybdopterin-dependent oxidoreductase [Geobacter sp. SVR]|uniref:molybdopterin-dependent oxidoreductase n=1 Tax=Geobacter sp. SVR TaxID=2495594 RepID=UPI00143EFCD8|nr:molybdopterin-dependent oxidoreductase [Geobacter sp. SVR]BCS55523.1 NADH dehydrogenase subunit G [Geobacter sp. SVR]GCF83526.1 NADH dehydrogenase subunit G [Geobacter sp. SVR]
MVNLTIDDKQVTAPKTATIYEAAKLNGINIPILCHDSKLKPFGACRMCLVEVEQMKGRQIPACTTPVTEGMIIRTSTPDIVKARKMVLELLLLNHPIDCPVCDKGGDCDLQNLTYEYQVSANRFTDEKFQHEIDYNNPLIERDMNRCVLCGKCARICDEVVSFGALTFIDRGIETKIGCEFEGALNCEFCGSCVSVCPVGSLLARPFKFKARFWALTKQKSVCGYCGTGCNLTLGVQDNKVLTTIYDAEQGFHKGLLCARGRFGYQFINNDKRLTKPMVRKDGALREASWDEALQFVAGRLKGGNVAALSTARLTNEEFVLFKDLMKLAGSASYDHSAGYAHSALTKGLSRSFGVAASTATILDIQKSDLLLVIKTDAYETHPVVGFEINQAVKNKGVKLSILSDKRGKLGKLPGAKTLVHAPGTEIALLNAITKVILDEKLTAGTAASVAGFAELERALSDFTPEAVAGQTGIDAASIVQFARDYASAEKALIIFPTGLAYPGHNADLASAAANLAILTGKLGTEGSGVLCMAEKNNSQGAVDMGFYPANGGKDAGQILEDCASGSVKTLFVAGENPLVSYPDRSKVSAALDKVDCLIVSDLFLSETAAMADVVLPACSFAEKEGTFTSVDRRVQYFKPAIKKVGLSKSDFEIFSVLINLLGGQAPASPAAAFADIAASAPGYAGMSYAKLGEEGAFAPVDVKPALVAPAVVRPTVEQGKLALLVGSVLYHCGTLSQYGEGPMYVCPEGYVEISRADAAAHKVSEGDLLTVTSSTGSTQLKARISPRLPAGVVFAPYHFEAAQVNTIWSGAAVTWVTVGK